MLDTEPAGVNHLALLELISSGEMDNKKEKKGENMSRSFLKQHMPGS